jgi:amino-acid N-acetyltransferase
MSQAQNSEVIRKVRMGEVPQIHRLLSNYAGQGLLLPRSLSEIYDHLRDYFVIEDNLKSDEIVGVCALGICWEDLAEIRSLAVAEECQDKGYGILLVKRCLEEAVSLGVKKVFTLTYATGFFSKLGFKQIEKASLPHKIWADCFKCPKFPDCDEVAMMKEL